MFTLFSEKGYDVSIAELSKNVGLKPSSIYSHFESKEQIVYEMLRKEIEAFYSELQNEAQLLEERSVKESLKHMYFFAFKYYKDIKKFKFLNHIHLIQNVDLRNKCLKLRKEKGEEVSKKITLIFEKGVMNNEIKSEHLDNYIQLYISSLIGNLYIALLDENNLEKNFILTWEVFWSAISNNKTQLSN